MSRGNRTSAPRRPLTAAAVIAAVSLVVTACTGQPASKASSTAATTSAAVTMATGPVTHGRTTVTLENDAIHHVTVTDRPLAGTPGTQAQSLAKQLGLAVGQPVEIASTGPVGPAGVTITRTYARPLPAGATATLGYFDPQWQTWVAVPSTLSADRTTLRATVHHLSMWDDFVSGTQAAMTAITDSATKVADWSYYQVGKVFDTRIDAPTCTSSRPTWVKDAVFIAADRNNPILFCVGQDPKHSDIVVVKAGVNRGFGYKWTATTAPAWTWNSGQDPSAARDIDQALSGLDKVFADAGRSVAGDSSLVRAGQEIDLGFAEGPVRSARDPLVQLVPQDTLGFLIGTLGSLVGTDVSAMADGPVIAAIALAGCGNDLRTAKDGAGATKAALSCVSALDEDVARQLAKYLLKRGVTNPGQLAGKLVARAGMYLALVGPAFSGMNYWAARAQDKAAGAVTLTLAAQPALAAPVAIRRYQRHDFWVDLRPDHTATVQSWGCSLPDQSCAQYGDGTWKVVDTKVRFTISQSYYVDNNNVRHPVPSSYWRSNGGHVWGNAGDFIDLWKSPTPGTVTYGLAYQGAYEYTGDGSQEMVLCATGSTAGDAAAATGICGA